MANTPYDQVQLRRTNTVPQKEGIYIMEKDGVVHLVNTRATMMGLLIIDGPRKNKTVTEVGIATWTGPFKEAREAHIAQDFIRTNNYQ